VKLNRKHEESSSSKSFNGSSGSKKKNELALLVKSQDTTLRIALIIK